MNINIDEFSKAKNFLEKMFVGRQKELASV